VSKHWPVARRLDQAMLAGLFAAAMLLSFDKLRDVALASGAITSIDIPFIPWHARLPAAQAAAVWALSIDGGWVVGWRRRGHWLAWALLGACVAATVGFQLWEHPFGWVVRMCTPCVAILAGLVLHVTHARQAAEQAAEQAGRVPPEPVAMAPTPATPPRTPTPADWEALRRAHNKDRPLEPVIASRGLDPVAVATRVEGWARTNGHKPN
jgi:hypothetical protein